LEIDLRLVRQARTAAILGVALARTTPRVLGRYRFPRAAERLLDGFAGDPVPNSAYDNLVRYMATAWVTYRVKSGAGAKFPGLPSWSGSECDALEGFSRIMPLFAAWCASGRDPVLDLPDGSRLSLVEEFRRGLIAGTDPDSASYWGDMPGKSNQRIVEAADIALALWLFRDTVWTSLAPGEREGVVRWLSRVEGRPGLDKNWHLFFVLIDRVLSALGYGGRISGVRDRFERVKDFHIGEGWFSDGPDGPVDYYNAWGFHYPMIWIDRIDPDWDPEFIRTRLREFLGSYRYLIGPEGFPIMGRSIPYRMAVPAPLVAGVEYHPDVIAPGEARRGLDSIWRHFVRNGGVRHGAPTQGYHAPDLRLVDRYSGPASSLWSLRSVVMAFYYPPEHPFWRDENLPLPVETQDFDFAIEPVGWRIRGDQETGEITIEVLSNPEHAEPALEQHGWVPHLQMQASLRPRALNTEAKYKRRFYSSKHPFTQEKPRRTR